MGISDYTKEMDRLRLKLAYLTNAVADIYRLSNESFTREEIARVIHQLRDPDGEWLQPPVKPKPRKVKQPTLF